MLNTARQIGVALGVASLVANLSSRVSVDPIPTYRHGLTLIIGLLVAAAVVAATLLTARADAALADDSGTVAAGSAARSTGHQSQPEPMADGLH
jgi:hypothetical protein